MEHSRQLDLLVTGFGPFPGVRINPTTALARAVALHLARSGFRARALILETSYAGGLPALAAAIEATGPGAVLMLGLAARARHVRVELFGRGRASILHPDTTGRAASRRTASAGRPMPTTGRPLAALSHLRQAGIVARLSPSAGRYLCDASYAASLRHPGLSGRPVLFIHVPWLRPVAGTRPARSVAGFRPDAAQLAGALARIGRGLTVAGRRPARPWLTPTPEP
jgi:pyroglutamyl-peptidase